MLTAAIFCDLIDNPPLAAYASGSAAGFLSLRDHKGTPFRCRTPPFARGQPLATPAAGYPRGSLAAAPPLPKNLATLRSAAIFGNPIFLILAQGKSHFSASALNLPKGFREKGEAARFFYGVPLKYRAAREKTPPRAACGGVSLKIAEICFDSSKQISRAPILCTKTPRPPRRRCRLLGRPVRAGRG